MIWINVWVICSLHISFIIIIIEKVSLNVLDIIIIIIIIIYCEIKSLCFIPNWSLWPFCDHVVYFQWNNYVLCQWCCPFLWSPWHPTKSSEWVWEERVRDSVCLIQNMYRYGMYSSIVVVSDIETEKYVEARLHLVGNDSSLISNKEVKLPMWWKYD